MRNIVLTGFMGTGKTEIGTVLAKKLGFAFVDIDHLIEKEQGMPVAEIFRRYGEERFRELEAEAVRKVSGMKRVVISTGGGAVLRDENVRNLRSSGVLICLTASPEVIFGRIGQNRNRPLLQVPDPLAKIKELLAARIPYYEKSDIMIDTDGLTPLSAADEIINTLPHLNNVRAGEQNGKS